jgi:hypothetical protein
LSHFLEVVNIIYYDSSIISEWGDYMYKIYEDYSEIASILLTRGYKDKTILPIIVDLIFSKNRRGLFNHDLIWIFFEAREPFSLMLVANYLGSKDTEDLKLAHKLLDFVPCIGMPRGNDFKIQYMAFVYWLQENYPFLYFTGESFQRTSKPMPYRVILDAKYLCKEVSLHTGEVLIPLSENDKLLASNFNNLYEDNKLLLSKFSVRIHEENIHLWNSWINRPVAKQISIAKARIGGVS